MKTVRTFRRYLDCYYFERTKILRFLIGSRKLHVFSFLSMIFLITFMEKVCPFPRYFFLHVGFLGFLLIIMNIYLQTSWTVLLSPQHGTL